jgi:hypothetical protein
MKCGCSKTYNKKTTSMTICISIIVCEVYKTKSSFLKKGLKSQTPQKTLVINQR